MTLPRLAPMPHEFVLAHAGRIGLFCCGRIDMNRRLRLVERVAEEHRKGAADFSLLEQLATIAEMSVTDYAKHHSLLPTLRVADSDIDPVLHGSAKRPVITRNLGARLHTAKVHVCCRCVDEDILHWGYSWFRRTHNLVGVEVCPVHGEALNWVTDPDPFSRLPQHWVKLGDIRRVEHDPASQAERQFQTRLHEIYEIFFDRDRPFASPLIDGSLALRLHALGLVGSFNGKKPLLSDYVLNSTPRAWLLRHCPQLCKKEPGVLFSSFDRLPRPYALPGAGFAYAIAFATLFDSAEDVARALSKPVVQRKRDDKNSGMETQKRRSSGEWMFRGCA